MHICVQLYKISFLMKLLTLGSTNGSKWIYHRFFLLGSFNYLIDGLKITMHFLFNSFIPGFKSYMFVSEQRHNSFFSSQGSILFFNKILNIFSKYQFKIKQNRQILSVMSILEKNISSHFYYLWNFFYSTDRTDKICQFCLILN